MTRAFTVAAVALVAALGTSATASADEPPQYTGHLITVETRNLYVGFDAAGLLSGAITPAQAWTDVLRSDPASRAESWADEIAEGRPDVVGLQEATLFRTGSLLDPAPASTVAFDFVALLIDALANRGLRYVSVATATNFDAEAPVGPPYLFDARITDRDVLLVRADSQTGHLDVVDASAGNFAAALPAGPITLRRGWNSVDLKVHGRAVRVVNTHLEAFHEGIRLAQASELLAGAAANAGPTIMLGDFNSGPPAATPTYRALTQGFRDVWSAVGAGAGLTCCHVDLMPTPFDRRIDLVLVDPSVTPVDAEVIGDEPSVGFPFFPSDHAGVRTTVELP